MTETTKSFVEPYLAYLAKNIYRRYRPFVIGVTGSSGKTTIKEMIGKLSGANQKNVLVSPGNMNTELGLPLAVLGFKKSPRSSLEWFIAFIVAPFKSFFTFSYYKYLVLEYAADKPGDIDILCKIISPDITVISNIGVAHLEFFDEIGKIAREKWILAQNTHEKIIMAEEVFSMCHRFGVPKAEISLIGKRVTSTAENIKHLTSGSEFNFFLLSKSKKINFKFLGDHNIEDLELAALAAVNIERNVEKIFDRIEELKPEKGRGQRIINKEMLIVDESYNANPVSMIATLKSFAEIKYNRKVVILGEMKEIGPISKKSHEEVAKLAKETADFTIGVGALFRDSGFDKWYANVSELLEEIEDSLGKNDAVLVKGSHSNGLERVVERLSK